MNTVAIIPARYASSRFPGKPLVMIHGKTMLERVWNAAMAAERIDAVLVATDDERIMQECQRIGAEAVMTSSSLPSGTDRVAEAMRLRYPSADVVLNVQGDEPLLKPELIDDLAAAIALGNTDVATPIQRITSPLDLDNPTICKVVLGDGMRAMYFSRSCIPHVRGIEGQHRIEQVQYWKHIGLYAYTRQALERFISLPQHPYEIAEQLEQLRLLAAGATYTCIETSHQLIAIDTPADADTVRDYVRADS